jgi:dipeptidase E
MTTRIYLGGGGSPDDETQLWQEFLAPGLRVVYWPFALARERFSAGRRWLVQALEPWDGVGLETWTDLHEHDPAELAEVDVLFVGGGNTFDLLHHVQVTGWLAPTREHVLSGAVLYGGSAGAVLAGADIAIAGFADPNDVGITDTSGLDVLSGAIVRPHYAGAGDDAECRRRAEESGRTVLAIPERGGLVVEGDDVRAVGPDPSAAFSHDGRTDLPPGTTHPLR